MVGVDGSTDRRAPGMLFPGLACSRCGGKITLSFGMATARGAPTYVARWRSLFWVDREGGSIKWFYYDSESNGQPGGEYNALGSLPRGRLAPPCAPMVMSSIPSRCGTGGIRRCHRQGIEINWTNDNSSTPLTFVAAAVFADKRKGTLPDRHNRRNVTTSTQCGMVQYHEQPVSEEAKHQDPGVIPRTVPAIKSRSRYAWRPRLNSARYKAYRKNMEQNRVRTPWRASARLTVSTEDPRPCAR